MILRSTLVPLIVANYLLTEPYLNAIKRAFNDSEGKSIIIDILISIIVMYKTLGSAFNSNKPSLLTSEIPISMLIRGILTLSNEAQPLSLLK